jgi:hypothetical protein
MGQGGLRTVQFAVGLALACVVGATAGAQPVPRPFPDPGGTQARPVPPLPPAPPRPEGTAPAPATAGAPQTAPAADPGAPNEALLGLPIMPNARFLASYDAGRGQRYYLFGSLASFVEVVAYYKTVLKQKGDLVFDVPLVHMFEVGRFREETMAFPPGVTVKDYASGGFGGYLDTRPGADPQRFPTIIQFVPVAPGERR